MSTNSRLVALIGAARTGIGHAYLRDNPQIREHLACAQQWADKGYPHQALGEIITALTFCLATDWEKESR